MPSARAFAFTAAMRMVYGIHGNPAYSWSATKPSGFSRFAQGYALMLQITQLANRGHTVSVNKSDLTLRKLDAGESTLSRGLGEL